MISIEDQIISQFPEFRKSNEFVEKLKNVGQMMQVPAYSELISVGQYIKVIPFLIDGLIKIYREDDQGNEILLYYIHSGESCVMSITTSLNNEKASIKAIVEDDSTILAVPKDDFIGLLKEFNLLQSFTYNLFRSKYDELINSIDHLAFNDTKSRLKQYLLMLSGVKKTKVLTGLTHKQIAHDLATSREVISRLLSLLKREEFLKMDKRTIEILDS